MIQPLLPGGRRDGRGALKESSVVRVGIGNKAIKVRHRSWQGEPQDRVAKSTSERAAQEAARQAPQRAASFILEFEITLHCRCVALDAARQPVERGAAVRAASPNADCL